MGRWGSFGGDPGILSWTPLLSPVPLHCGLFSPPFLKPWSRPSKVRTHSGVGEAEETRSVVDQSALSSGATRSSLLRQVAQEPTATGVLATGHRGERSSAAFPEEVTGLGRAARIPEP